MKTFHVRGEHEDDEYIGDIRRIQAVVQAHGYECSVAQARKLWDMYSDSMAAGWMILPESDDDIWWSVSTYIVED